MTSDSDLNISHLAKTLLEIYKQLKVQLTHSPLEQDNTPLPIIQWMTHDNNIHIAGFSDNTSRLAEVISSLRDSLGNPVAVGFSSDARFKVFDNEKYTDDQKNDFINDYKRGQMHEDFSNGDMTVKEALITVVNTSNISHSIMCEYTYDDFGEIIFGESTESHNHVGLVSDSLAHAFVNYN